MTAHDGLLQALADAIDYGPLFALTESAKGPECGPPIAVRAIRTKEVPLILEVGPVQRDIGPFTRLVIYRARDCAYIMSLLPGSMPVGSTFRSPVSIS